MKKIIFILFLLFPLDIYAASYTVGDSGRNYTTIQAAINACTNGTANTITVYSPYSGNEVLTLNKSGAGIGTELIIQGNAGDTITIQRGTFSSGVQYVILKNLRFYTPASQVGVSSQGASNVNYITLDGNIFTGASNRCRAVHQNESMTNHNWTVKNNTFTGTNTGCGEPEMFWCASYSIVENNLQYGHDNDFMHVFGRNIVIRNNTQRNPVSNSHGYDFVQTYGNGGASFYAYNIIVEGNTQHDEQTAEGFQTIGNFSDDDRTTDFHDWTFRNNILYNTNFNGNFGMPNIRFYNNLFHNTDATQNAGWPIDIRNANGWGHSTNMIIKNNIFIGNGNNSSDSGWYAPNSGTSFPSGFTADYNFISRANFAAYTSFYIAFVGGGREAHGINGGNPQFLDFTNHDYHLTSASTVLINKGTDLSGTDTPVQIGANNLSYSHWTSFNYDKDGNTRSSGSWDIGPYEYSSSGDTQAPQVPKGLIITPQ